MVKRFGERTILDGVSFRIYEGEVTTIIGLSGTGKSVTLKHIIGLLRPDAGEIRYRGDAAPDDGPGAVGRLHRPHQLHVSEHALSTR